MNNQFNIFKKTRDWLTSQNISFSALDSIDSTNNQAKDEAATIRDNLKIYIAANQTAGRGRGDNHWLSSNPADNLLASWSIHLPSSPQSVTSPIIGLCVYESLLKIFSNLKISIKAPNDIYLGHNKTLGILVESISMGDSVRLIVGIGLNVFSHPSEIPNATHLAEHCDISENSWFDFLATLTQNLMHAARASTGAHLTPEQRDKILLGLNSNPNLPHKYVAVSPFGDLITENETFSWRDL